MTPAKVCLVAADWGEPSITAYNLVKAFGIAKVDGQKLLEECEWEGLLFRVKGVQKRYRLTPMGARLAWDEKYGARS